MCNKTKPTQEEVNKLYRKLVKLNIPRLQSTQVGQPSLKFNTPMPHPLKT